MADEWDARQRTLTAIDDATQPGALRLVGVQGPAAGTTLELSPGVHAIGKAPGCTLQLDDATLSRRHVELTVDDAVRVRDLASKNGTFLNGVRVAEGVLQAGAILRVGENLFEVHDTGATSVDHFGELWGTSPPMLALFDLAARAAPRTATILIEGETGTGKELLAAALHAASGRKGAFVTCDLGGVTSSLIESDLFGHRRGAFTGADQHRDGTFVEAKGGTVFLDELGELEPALQPRLLRVLEQRTVKPLGGDRELPVDVRVIAATNRDLDAEVKEGRFRSDLYHRLAVVRLRLPPLRERKTDLPLLVERLLRGQGVAVPPETLSVLSAYNWPGNVRELRNVLERGVALLGRGERVLRPSVLGMRARASDAARIDEPTFQVAKEQLVAEWEQRYVEDLIARADGNISKAARVGGLTRIHLHRLVKKHAIRLNREGKKS